MVWILCFEHDLFRKPVSTFRDHALGELVERLGGALGLDAFGCDPGGDVAHAGHEVGGSAEESRAGAGIAGFKILPHSLLALMPRLRGLVRRRAAHPIEAPNAWNARHDPSVPMSVPTSVPTSV